MDVLECIGKSTCCVNCTKYAPFQPVLDLKELGVTVLRYVNNIMNQNMPGSGVSQFVDTQDKDPNIFIILNTNNINISSEDIFPNFDIDKITCPRCRYRAENIQKLLKNKIEIGKGDVKGICDHCKGKQELRKPCAICEDVIKEFVAASLGKTKPTEASVKEMVPHVHHILKATKVERTDKKYQRKETKSETTLNILKMVRSHPEPETIKPTQMPEKSRQEKKLVIQKQKDKPKIVEFPSDESIITPFLTTFSEPDKKVEGSFKYVFPQDVKKEEDITKVPLVTSSELIMDTRDKIRKQAEEEEKRKEMQRLKFEEYSLPREEEKRKQEDKFIDDQYDITYPKKELEIKVDKQKQLKEKPSSVSTVSKETTERGKKQKEIKESKSKSDVESAHKIRQVKSEVKDRPLQKDKSQEIKAKIEKEDIGPPPTKEVKPKKEKEDVGPPITKEVRPKKEKENVEPPPAREPKAKIEKEDIGPPPTKEVKPKKEKEDVGPPITKEVKPKKEKEDVEPPPAKEPKAKKEKEDVGAPPTKEVKPKKEKGDVEPPPAKEAKAKKEKEDVAPLPAKEAKGKKEKDDVGPPPTKEVKAKKEKDDVRPPPTKEVKAKKEKEAEPLPTKEVKAKKEKEDVGPRPSKDIKVKKDKEIKEPPPAKEGRAKKDKEDVGPPPTKDTKAKKDKEIKEPLPPKEVKVKKEKEDVGPPPAKDGKAKKDKEDVGPPPTKDTKVKKDKEIKEPPPPKEVKVKKEDVGPPPAKESKAKKDKEDVGPPPTKDTKVKKDKEIKEPLPPKEVKNKKEKEDVGPPPSKDVKEKKDKEIKEPPPPKDVKGKKGSVGPPPKDMKNKKDKEVMVPSPKDTTDNKTKEVAGKPSKDDKAGKFKPPLQPPSGPPPPQPKPERTKDIKVDTKIKKDTEVKEKPEKDVKEDREKAEPKDKDKKGKGEEDKKGEKVDKKAEKEKEAAKPPVEKKKSLTAIEKLLFSKQKPAEKLKVLDPKLAIQQAEERMKEFAKTTLDKARADALKKMALPEMHGGEYYLFKLDVIKPPEVFEKKKKRKLKEFGLKNIKVRRPSYDDLVLQMIRMTKEKQKKMEKQKQKHEKKYKIRSARRQFSYGSLIIDSELELAFESLINITKDLVTPYKIRRTSIVRNIREKVKPILQPEPLLFHVIHDRTEPLQVFDLEEEKHFDTDQSKGIIRYKLSDRTFIDKGWTLLPMEKVVRKMNIYKVRPTNLEFDWLAHSVKKEYDNGQRFAQLDEDGRGRWFYRNGGIALDYYDCEERNAQQRFVIYSNVDTEERCHVNPVTVLAMFDYLGNGVVFDHSGKIRVKYNQTEGVLLDRNVGTPTRWKWHTLNDPPVLKQVMIETYMTPPDPEIIKIGRYAGEYDMPRYDEDDERIAIEIENYIKEKERKLTQKFKPFQISMKVLKINEQFSLKILDQSRIYLNFDDGAAHMKLNLGMILDSHEILDSETADFLNVANSLERLPPATDSLADLQKSLIQTRKQDRLRAEHIERVRGPPAPVYSIDNLVKAKSKPLRPPLTVAQSNNETGYRKPSQSNLYYDTRLI